MKYTEELDWILDKKKNKINAKEEYCQNIDFVHSLGLKCDCVGWSTLNLSDSRAEEILSAIDSFCKENRWNARGYYSRKYVEYESDWYELAIDDLRDNTIQSIIECEGEQGNAVRVTNIQAYREMKPSPKAWRDQTLVPERFRNACLRHHISDVDFCCAKDKGKYEAEQYFHLYCNHQIRNIAIDGRLRLQDSERIKALGGFLPRIADIFYELDRINLQDCYLESDMPDCCIAHAYALKIYPYFDGTNQKIRTECIKNNILIHKRFAEVLLREKVISPRALRPAMIVKELPKGYTLQQTSKMDRPTSSFMNQSIEEYEKLKSTKRPVRVVSERDALKLLRDVKREQKEDYKKAMPKGKRLIVAETKYGPLVPYYSIANGGFLSDEYELLSYEDACVENDLFFEELRAEELLEEKPDGIVFVKCPDGDKIILCENGSVIRFSHEEPAATEEWPSLAQFIVDAVNE